MNMLARSFDAVCNFRAYILAAGAIFGVTFVPFLYIVDENNQKCQEQLTDLDRRPSVVFNSVASCVERGFSLKDCQESNAKAVDIAESLRRELSYSTMSECIQNHGNCYKVSRVEYPHIAYYYKPPVIAWQAAQDNLSQAVPLYSGPTVNTAIRRDGKQFSLQ